MSVSVEKLVYLNEELKKKQWLTSSFSVEACWINSFYLYKKIAFEHLRHLLFNQLKNSRYHILNAEDQTLCHHFIRIIPVSSEETYEG